jgi:hypothetical protein
MSGLIKNITRENIIKKATEPNKNKHKIKINKKGELNYAESYTGTAYSRKYQMVPA